MMIICGLEGLTPAKHLPLASQCAPNQHKFHTANLLATSLPSFHKISRHHCSRVKFNGIFLEQVSEQKELLWTYVIYQNVILFLKIHKYHGKKKIRVLKKYILNFNYKNELCRSIFDFI